tara:strand:- start:443 stop:664 length:222 start_codon:yes stop_codon:yes gene_type:complete
MRYQVPRIAQGSAEKKERPETPPKLHKGTVETMTTTATDKKGRTRTLSQHNAPTLDAVREQLSGGTYKAPRKT